MQNTDKQRIIHLIGVPDIEGDQVHRIVPKECFDMLIFAMHQKQKIPVKY